MPESTENVRIAMIGAGGMADRVHYPSLASFDDVEVVATCDINTQRLHSTADKYGVEKRYIDYRKMVGEVAPHGVYAIGPPHTMYNIWTWCLEQKLNINFLSVLLQFDNGATGVMINSWTSGRRIFAVEMHAPGICVEAEHEGKGYLYADGDTRGIEYDTKEVADSDELYVYGGFQVKNREFIDCLKTRGQPSSHFADALKTMEVAEKILAQATLKGI